MMVALLYFLFIALVPFVQGDRIMVHEPIKGGRFKPGSIMNIDYTVRFEGMAKLGSSSVSILYPNHTVITFLPEANWVDTPTGRRGASTSWTIPSDLGEGEYRLRISGPAIYMCSEKGNGQAPYNRCKMSMRRTRTFTVATDGVDGMEPNENNQNGNNQGDVIADGDQIGVDIDIDQGDVNIDIDQGDVSIDDNQNDQSQDNADDEIQHEQNDTGSDSGVSGEAN
ncbi:hypothetical protein BCR42DRAFT_415344 [Absidia repens]|uniref:Ser-Thr-rich glycosyl-phosphatidyl-inositol-anchored membrane family-domain-containing protein n=1 Tax=Absidia repens TaxID=90262 RepID=A0A1X2IHK1_9FUNG|nr:hypothetical protein BCR42DRAFT_415344 [Absidia repens]